MFDDERPDLSIRTTRRLEPGINVQFTEGDWETGHVPGIVISEEAFDLVQEAISTILPGIDRYGVTSVPAALIAPTVAQLRQSATSSGEGEVQALLRGVAEYCEGVNARGLPLTVLGY